MTKVNSKLVDEILKQAKEQLRRTGHLSPTFFMRRGNKVDMTNLDILPNKDLWSSLMRTLIVNIKPAEYAFLSESWLKIFNPKNPADKLESELVTQGIKEVHDLADKIECIIIVYGSKDTAEKTGLIKFRRLQSGIEFSELEWFPTTVTGRLANLWNPFGGEDKSN
jgi:hypothetical protein